MADTTEQVPPDDAKLTERQALASALIEIAISDDEDADSLGYQEGDTIGRYTLVKVLGRGGFGVVWEARQAVPISRDVALKIILPGMDSRAVISRFRTERQALARMSHPNIATVLDADTTEDSLPYFVMELVRGEAITTYAKTWSLGVRERIAMFLDVCSAIQHAHQRAILHRDLKPSNILVAQVDGKPVPKVIDFGIAKALTDDAVDMPSVVFTVQGQMIGTPQYMAPEHAVLGSDQVDVRADVFSLGAILYELLTGRPQMEAEETKPTSAKVLFQRICNEEPIKPSTRVRQIGRTSAAVDLPATQIDRELDWIVLKSLEKSPDERYASVEALASDLQRYLSDEPLSVGPPTALYRLRKLVRKNRAAFVLGAVVVASLIAVAFVYYSAYLRESKARFAADVMRQRAESSEAQAVDESRRATQLVSFLNELLKNAGTEIDEGKNPEALRLAIDKSAKKIDHFENQPDLQAALCRSLASVFDAMGDRDSALPLWERQWRIYVDQFGPDNYETLGVKLSIAGATAEGANADLTKSSAMLEEICRTLEAQGKISSGHWFDARRKMALNLVQTGHSPEALAIADDLMGRRNGRGEPALEKVSFLKALGSLQRGSGDLDGAEKTFMLGLERVPDEPTSSEAMHERATLLHMLSRIEGDRKHYDLAIGHLEEAITLDKNAKVNRVIVIKMLIEVSRHYSKAQRFNEAAQVTSDALAIAWAIGDSKEKIHATRACADILEEGDRPDQALAYRTDCEALSRERSTEIQPWMEDLRLLIRLLTRLKRHNEAEVHAKELWQAVQTYPQFVSAKEPFSRDFFHTLIDTCTAWQTATGSHDHDADLVVWRGRLKALEE